MFEFISPFFRRLYDSTGYNFNVFYDRFLFDQLLDGIHTTLLMTAACLTLSVAIGLIGALAQESRSKLAGTVVEIYIQIFRNTPPFVQLLFFYFVIGQYIPGSEQTGGTLFTAFTWAVIALGCFGGAFNIEIFRASLQAVPATTREAAESLGYTTFRAFRYVTLPLAARFSLPTLTGNLISLLKTTSLSSTIAVPEITQICIQTWTDYYNVGEMMIVLFAMYNILVGIFITAMYLIQRAVRLPGYIH